MNRGDVELLLAYCAAADPRFNTADEMQASARVAVWLDQLGDADAGWVNAWVRRHYSHHHDWPLTVGAVRTAWLHEVDRREALARRAALPEAGMLRPPPTDASREVIEQTRAEVRAAAERGPVERRPVTAPRPVRAEVYEGGAGHGR